jgi:hypothetical protein
MSSLTSLPIVTTSSELAFSVVSAAVEIIWINFVNRKLIMMIYKAIHMTLSLLSFFSHTTTRLYLEHAHIVTKEGKLYD